MDMVEHSTARAQLVRHDTALQVYQFECTYVQDRHCFLPLCELARLLTCLHHFLNVTT